MPDDLAALRNRPAIVEAIDIVQTWLAENAVTASDVALTRLTHVIATSLRRREQATER